MQAIKLANLIIANGVPDPTTASQQCLVPKSQELQRMYEALRNIRKNR